MESPTQEELGKETPKEVEENDPKRKSPSKGFLMHILDDDEEIDDMSDIEEPPIDELSSLEISQTRVETDEYGSPEHIRRPVLDDLPTDLSPSERMEALQERCQILREEGCLDETIDVKVQMLAMSRIIYGLRSVQTAQSLWDLAETYMELENPEQASRHLRDAHEILSECRDASARELFPKLLLTMGVCHTLLGRYQDAFEYLKSAIRDNEFVHGLDHASSFGIYFAAGRLFSIRKNYDRALDFFSKAWEVKEKDTEDQNAIDLADVHREIAYIHSQKDDLLDSQSHLREAYKIVKSHDETSDDVLIDILVDLVDVDGKLHSQSTQLQYANEAMQIIKQRQEEERKRDWNRSLLIHLKEIVVDILRETGSLEKALEEMEEACVLIKSAYGGRDVRYADACWKLADMCKEAGDEEIAVELYRKVHLLLMSTLGGSHKKVMRIRRCIEDMDTSHDSGSISSHVARDLWDEDGFTDRQGNKGRH